MMKEITSILAWSMGFFACASVSIHGTVLETTFDCQKGEYTEIVATGFVDIDAKGFFLNIAESNNRIYFPLDAAGIAKLYANQTSVRMAAKISKDINNIYFAKSWVLTSKKTPAIQ